MTIARSVRALMLSWIAAATSVHAGQPLATDDAAVVAPKTCQLETWSEFEHDGREYWAQPACNFGGNLELSVGAARAHPQAGAQSTVVQLQAKTVLSPRGDGDWSFGVSGGGARDTVASHGNSSFQTYYARALASWYPRSDIEIDLNVGAANVYGSGSFALAGVATQYSIVPDLQLLAEIFRDEPGHGKYQAALRYIVVPDRFETFISYGNRFNDGRGAWSAIAGIRLQTAPLIP